MGKGIRGWKSLLPVGKAGMSLIELSIVAGLSLMMIGAFTQVMLSSRVDLERMGAKVAVTQLRSQMDTALLGNIGSRVFSVNPELKTEFETLGPTPVFPLPATRSCRKNQKSEEIPFASTDKIPYSAMHLGGPIFEVGKKLAASSHVEVQDAYIVQLSADGNNCEVGQNSACHSSDCSFMNVVKLASTKPGWPGNVTIEQPLVCRTEWIATSATTGYEQMKTCRLTGTTATAANPSASPSPCLGDIDFDGYTTPMEYDIVRASEGVFGGPGVPCDYLRLFKAMDQNSDNAIGPEDWGLLKPHLGCQAPLKRCFSQSPAYFAWQNLALAWSSGLMSGAVPQVFEYKDLAAVEYCFEKFEDDLLPPELQPIPNPTPAKACGAINIDGSYKLVKKPSGQYAPKTIDSRDVFLARALSKLYPTGPEYPTSCPSGIPSFDTTGLSCDQGYQPAPVLPGP